MSPLIRRLLIALIILFIIFTAVWWIKRPQPISVAVKEIDRGKVESSIANTRVGTVDACQRTKLSTIMGARSKERGPCQKRPVADEVVERRSAGEKHIGHDTGRHRTDAEARRTSCDATKADVAQFLAKVEATPVEQGRTILYAPFAGIVAKIVGEVGEYSTPSPPGVPTPPAIDLIDDTCLYITAPLDEVDAPKIRAGQPVRISLDALPKQSFPGKFKRVVPYVSAVEKQARTVDIEATFDHPEASGKLLVGYSADIEVILAVRDDVVRVPTLPPHCLKAGA